MGDAEWGMVREQSFGRSIDLLSRDDGSHGVGSAVLPDLRVTWIRSAWQYRVRLTLPRETAAAP
jgi:hypothetical protein